MAYEPQFSENALEFRAKILPGVEGTFAATDPEFVERFVNFCFGDVIEATPLLTERVRALGWLGTLLGCQGVDEFRAMLPATLNMGLSPEDVKEVVYQASAYLGLGRVYPFLVATNEVLAMRGVELPLEKQATTEPTYESRVEAGNQAQVDIFGEQMRGYQDAGNPDYPWINQWLAAHCFGDWYTRGSLTLAEREIITFSFIAAQGGCEAQLKGHTNGNITIGNSRELLIQLVSSNLPFIGYPRSLNALAVIDEVTGS